MKARHFGASSYDDEYDEEEAMDMSGFIGSTTTEQPPVIERKRASRVPPTNEGLGNEKCPSSTKQHGIYP